MRYVVYDTATGELRSAVTGPEPASPGVGLGIGDAGDFQLEGAIKNYIFVQDENESLSSTGVARGSVARKPPEQWGLEAEEQFNAQHRKLLRFHRLDVREVRRIEVLTRPPSSATQSESPTGLAAVRVRCSNSSEVRYPKALWGRSVL